MKKILVFAVALIFGATLLAFAEEAKPADPKSDKKVEKKVEKKAEKKAE